MKVLLLGTNKPLTEQLKLCGYSVISIGRHTSPSIDFTSAGFVQDFRRILSSKIVADVDKLIINSGFLQSTRITDQSHADIINSHLINCSSPVRAVEEFLNFNSNAEIVVIGSESGAKGSYDLSYALAKSALRMYVRERRLKTFQRLVLLSPSTIEDFGMTVRRTDKNRLEQYRTDHPQHRFLSSAEVASTIHAIFTSSSFLTNTEIELYGGKFTRMNF